MHRPQPSSRMVSGSVAILFSWTFAVVVIQDEDFSLFYVRNQYHPTEEKSVSISTRSKRSETAVCIASCSGLVLTTLCNLFLCGNSATWQSPCRLVCIPQCLVRQAALLVLTAVLAFSVHPYYSTSPLFAPQQKANSPSVLSAFPRLL